MGVRLPSEYQEVQYIQCSGYQYINTGVNLSSDDFEVFCRFAITQTTGSYEQALFSIWTSEYNYWNCLMKNTLDISVYTAAHHTANKRVVIGQIYNITVIRNVNTWSYVFDDDVVTWTYSPTTINDTPLTLCRRADLPNYAKSATHARIYDFSVKANGTIAAKYVPCYRKSDNKPGMYDLVSGTFFVNQDTGEDFTVGPDVIASISPLMVAWRRAMMEKKSDIHKLPLPLIYFKGLDRGYNVYTNMGNRASTAIDLPIKNGQTMVITVPSDIKAAVGAWREDTKELVLYGSWNLNLRYTPTVDVLAKIVFRRSDSGNVTDGEFAGKIDIQIGENIYKS